MLLYTVPKQHHQKLRAIRPFLWRDRVMAFIFTAAVGTLLGELLKEVWEAKKKADMFESILESMESTLTSVTQALGKIKVLNKELDLGDGKEIKVLWKKIEKGKKLVQGFRESKCPGCFKKPCYVKEIEVLDDSLKRFCQIVMPVLQAWIQMETLQQVDEIHDELIDTHEDVMDIQNKVKDIHEEAKVNHEVVRDIHEEVKDIGKEMKQVQDIRQDVKDTLFNVKDIDERVKDIHDGVKEVKDVHEEVKGTRVDVKDIREQVKGIHDEVKDMRNDLRLNIQPEKPTSPVSNNNVPLRPFTPPEPPQYTVGLDKPLKDLKNDLFRDGMSTIVLTGLGGCGKTTLAKKLCQDEDVKGKFGDNIFFITVSKAPNLKVIIQQLFWHKGRPVHEFRTDEEAVNCLEQLLKQIGSKPILLVLDDVWSGSESLLDKFKFPIREYKILFTSRSSLPGFDSTYKLEKLSSEDSLTLFRHSADLQDSTCGTVDDVVVNKIVNLCKGLPLALTVVGRSLREQPAPVWQNRAKKWSKGVAFIESHTVLLNLLKSSLDALDNKQKEYYMDLGAFPEGQLTPATAIIDMWEELYEMNADGLNSIASIHELSSLNLINLVVTRKDANEVEGYYNNHFVAQHDLLRDMVNHLSALDVAEQRRKRLLVEINGNGFPNWWTQQKKQTVNANLLSISTDEMFSSNWPDLHAPEVEVLVLSFRTKNYTLPRFIKNMDKLKALIVTNYGFLPAELSNYTVLGNLSNLKRIRLEQVSIPSLNLNCEQLENLQKISFFRCNIAQSIGDNTTQISDALPNLVEINISTCNNPLELLAAAFEIVLLKKLRITNCHDLSKLPQEIGKLMNLQVLVLSSCINLSELPDTIGSLNKLSILDISDCMSIKKLPDQIGELQNLRKLYMTGCPKCILPKSVTNLVHLKLVRDMR